MVTQSSPVLDAPQRVLAPSLARTATFTSPDQPSMGAGSVDVIIDVTTMASGGLTPTIRGKDPASGKYYTILTGTKIVGVSTVVLRVGRGVTAGANLVVNDALPPIWDVVLTADDATAITYSIGANLSK